MQAVESPGGAPLSAARKVRVCSFSAWAGALTPVEDYLAQLPAMDLRPLVADRSDAELMRKARLDCDWYGENARCLAAMSHPELTFLPAWIVGKAGVLDLAKAPREPGEERWFITMAQQPQAFGELASKVFRLLARSGVRQLYYAFDEASRRMTCFPEIAPHLDVLIHDEAPLSDEGRARLRPGAVSVHRSWVANVLPYAAPFNEAPEPKILFLGSQMGLTPHRRRQIDFLQRTFKDRFVASTDHSVGVGERLSLNRYQVGLCPEGRMFATPAMSRSHTDRPFWSGCLGLVPVSEDSAQGGRLDGLASSGLILRYAHGDLKALAEACEQALAMPVAARRRIYEHFNRHETVGTVVAAAIAAAAA